MIDHISTYALDYLATRDFYSKVFAPLGYALQFEFVTEDDPAFPTGRCAAFGMGDTTPFWVIETKEKATPRHIAFSASDHAAVEAFYHRAMETGATCNGKPGLRPEYHANYFAAFVIDPDGNDIEAVCHQPQQ